MRPLLVIFFMFCFTGCRPTYEHSNVISDIKALCIKEYKTDVNVAVAGNTVYATVAVEDFLPDIQFLTDDAYEILGNALFAVSRVVLSSSGKYSFIVLEITGLKGNSGRIRLKRYINDIKRFQLEDISRSEFFERMLVESEYPSGEKYAYDEIIYEDFLAKQAAVRMKKLSASGGDIFGGIRVSEINGFYLGSFGDLPSVETVEFLEKGPARVNMLDSLLPKLIPYYSRIKKKADFSSWQEEGFFRFEIKASVEPPAEKEHMRAFCSESDNMVRKLFKRYEFKSYSQIHYDLANQSARFVSLR